MKVAATEAEPADACKALAGRRGPRQCGAGEAKGTRRAIPRRIRTRERLCRWPYARPQRERSLDDAGDSSRALGMTDLRFDRADHTISWGNARGREVFANRRKLGAISDWRS